MLSPFLVGTYQPTPVEDKHASQVFSIPLMEGAVNSRLQTSIAVLGKIRSPQHSPVRATFVHCSPKTRAGSGPLFYSLAYAALQWTMIRDQFSPYSGFTFTYLTKRREKQQKYLKTKQTSTLLFKLCLQATKNEKPRRPVRRPSSVAAWAGTPAGNTKPWTAASS